MILFFKHLSLASLRNLSSLYLSPKAIATLPHLYSDIFDIHLEICMNPYKICRVVWHVCYFNLQK